MNKTGIERGIFRSGKKRWVNFHGMETLEPMRSIRVRDEMILTLRLKLLQLRARLAKNLADRAMCA